MDIDINKEIEEAQRRLEETQGLVAQIDQQMQELSRRRQQLLQQALRCDGEVLALRRIRGDKQTSTSPAKKAEAKTVENDRKARGEKPKKRK